MPNFVTKVFNRAASHEPVKKTMNKAGDMLINAGDSFFGGVDKVFDAAASHKPVKKVMNKAGDVLINTGDNFFGAIDKVFSSLKQ